MKASRELKSEIRPDYLTCQITKCPCQNGMSTVISKFEEKRLQGPSSGVAGRVCPKAMSCLSLQRATVDEASMQMRLFIHQRLNHLKVGG